jgi:hypothetical protein
MSENSIMQIESRDSRAGTFEPEEFSAEDIENVVNDFGVVHIYNKSCVYHLTKQTLLDSSLTIPNDESMTQNTYSFFYHILSKDLQSFNEIYGSFAYMTVLRSMEATLYLNVNSKALEYIVDYIQTGKLDPPSNTKSAEEIVDLATIFAMPDLVEKIRRLLLF